MSLNCLNKLAQTVLVITACASFYSSANCQTAFKIDIQSETAFALANTSKNQISKLHLQGDLALSPVTLDGKAGWWGVFAENMVAIVGSSSTPVNQYSVPFAFKPGQNGNIEQFWFSAPLDDQQQDMLKGLAYYFQGPSNVTLALAINETDSLGKYTITYKPHADKVLAIKSNYVNLNDKNIDQVEVINGAIQYRPSQCWFEEKIGSEELVIHSNNRTMTLFSKQHYTLKEQPIDKLKLFGLSSELNDWLSPALSLNGADIARLSAELNALLALDLSKISAHELTLKLKALDPVLGQLVSFFGSPTLSDAAQTRLMLALGKVDSPNSQNVLVDLLSTYPQRPDIQFRSLRALTVASSALDDLVLQKLTALVLTGITTSEAELQSNFYLTIGILAKTRDHGANMASIHNALEEVLHTTLDQTKQQAVLGAMGNTASMQHFESIQGFAITNNINQSTALRALGRLGQPEAKAALSSLLNRPIAEHSERALLNALGQYQLEQPVQDKVLHYLQSPSTTLKQAAITVLGQQKSLTPATKALLRQQIPLETDKKTVQLLINAIEQRQN